MSFQRTTALKEIIRLNKDMVLPNPRVVLPHSVTSKPDKSVISPMRLRGVPGGTSASKTISILLFLIGKAQKDPITAPTLTSIVSESIPHLKRGAIRDFVNIMKEHNYFKLDHWNQTDFIYTFETGSKIEFFSSDNGDKLRGARRDRLFINEANNVSFDAFEQLEVRTKDFIILDWNPSSEFWWYTEIKPNRDDWVELTLTYLDNEALDPNIIRSIEQRRNRKGWWQVYGLGQLGEVEGKIYKDWQIVDDIPHEARLERFGVDFGYSNDPTAIVAVYYYNGGYIIDEVLYKKEVSNKLISDAILSIPNGDKTLVVCDSAEPKSIAELCSYGLIAVPCEKGRDSVANNIQVVQNQRISMTKRSSNVIKEYRNFLWKTDKEGRILNIPEHEFKHSMDAIVYAITSLVKDFAGGGIVVHIPQYD